MTAIPLKNACAALGIAYWAPLMAVRRRQLATGPAPDYPITEVALQAWAARAKPAPAPSPDGDVRIAALEVRAGSLDGVTVALGVRATSLEGITATLETKTASLATVAESLRTSITAHHETLAAHGAIFARMKAEPMLAAWLEPKAPQ